MRNNVIVNPIIQQLKNLGVELVCKKIISKNREPLPIEIKDMHVFHVVDKISEYQENASKPKFLKVDANNEVRFRTRKRKLLRKILFPKKYFKSFKSKDRIFYADKPVFFCNTDSALYFAVEVERNKATISSCKQQDTTVTLCRYNKNEKNVVVEGEKILDHETNEIIEEQKCKTFTDRNEKKIVLNNPTSFKSKSDENEEFFVVDVGRSEAEIIPCNEMNKACVLCRYDKNNKIITSIENAILLNNSDKKITLKKPIILEYGKRSRRNGRIVVEVYRNNQATKSNNGQNNTVTLCQCDENNSLVVEKASKISPNYYDLKKIALKDTPFVGEDSKATQLFAVEIDTEKAKIKSCSDLDKTVIICKYDENEKIIVVEDGKILDHKTNEIMDLQKCKIFTDSDGNKIVLNNPTLFKSDETDDLYIVEVDSNKAKIRSCNKLDKTVVLCRYNKNKKIVVVEGEKILDHETNEIMRSSSESCLILRTKERNYRNGDDTARNIKWLLSQKDFSRLNLSQGKPKITSKTDYEVTNEKGEEETITVPRSLYLLPGGFVFTKKSNLRLSTKFTGRARIHTIQVVKCHNRKFEIRQEKFVVKSSSNFWRDNRVSIERFVRDSCSIDPFPLYNKIGQKRFRYLMNYFGDPLMYIYSDLRKEISAISPAKVNKFIFEIVKKLLNALGEIHNKKSNDTARKTRGFVHRDISSGNIMIEKVNGRYMVKIIDFDDIKPCNSLDDPQYPRGTMEYIAPEIVKQLCNAKNDMVLYTKKTDIYAMGLVIIKLLYNLNVPCSAQKYLYQPVSPLDYFFYADQLSSGKSLASSNLQQKYDEQLSNNLKMYYSDIKRSLGDEIANVIKKMTNTNPDERYNTVEEAKEAFRRAFTVGEKSRNFEPSRNQI